MEALAVKEIAAKYELWLNEFGNQCYPQEFRDKMKSLIEGNDYSVRAVYDNLRAMYGPYERKKVDARFEIERDVRIKHHLPITQHRLSELKREVYKIAKDNHLSYTNCAWVDTQTHVYFHDIGESKLKEVDEWADWSINMKLTDAIKYIELKLDELEAACNFSALCKD